jgi:hypothetical protein
LDRLQDRRTLILDWHGSAYAGTIPVTAFDEFIGKYKGHPESKAAAADGMPASEETRGVLGRLHLTGGAPRRIGKEVDRLDEDDEFTLDRPDPAEYIPQKLSLSWALEVLSDESTASLARLVGISTRRLDDVRKGRVKKVRARNYQKIIAIARQRENSWES